MACPISQSPDVSLRRSSEPENLLGGTFSVAFGMRSYSPELGRWINRDPIEESGSKTNRTIKKKIGRGRYFDYIFCSNLPVTRFDFIGLEGTAWDCWKSPLEYYCGKWPGLIKKACELFIKCGMSKPGIAQLRCQTCKSDCQVCCQLKFGDNGSGGQFEACILHCENKFQQCYAGGVY